MQDFEDFSGLNRHTCGMRLELTSAVDFRLKLRVEIATHLLNGFIEGLFRNWAEMGLLKVLERRREVLSSFLNTHTRFVSRQHEEVDVAKDVTSAQMIA